MNINSAVRAGKSVITANSPVLLVGTAIAGVVTTAVLAARAGYKARGMVITAEAETLQPLDNKEKAKLTWLCYAAPAVSGASTIAAVLGVHTIHTKRHAALAGLYAVTTSKLDDYQAEAEKLLGSKKTQQLNDAMGQKAVDEGRPFDSKEVIVLGGGTELMHDNLTNRWFMGSVPIVEKAIYDLNVRLLEDGDVSLNDYYEFVGLDAVPLGENMGWSGVKLEPRFGAVKTSDGRSAIDVWFSKAPKSQLGTR